MSANGTNVSEPEALGAQVEALAKESKALADALASTRSQRVILLLVLIIFIGGICLAFVRLGSQLTSKDNIDQLLQKGEKRLRDHSDKYTKHVQTLYEKTSPVLTEAFSAQAKKDLPRFIQAMEKERDTLTDNLSNQLTKKLEEKYKDVTAKHEKLLKEEFPQVQDEKLHAEMMVNIDAAVQKLVKRYYVEELKGQMQKINDAWDSFPPADTPKKDDIPLEDQFIAGLIELLKQKLVSNPDVVAQK